MEIMWEMAAIEGLEHAECVHQKLHFWKFLWTVCSTMQSTVESMMTRMMSTAFRCSRNLLSSRSPLCWSNEYMHVCMVISQRSAYMYRIFKKCKFCLFRAFYRCHFLHNIHTWDVTFKGKALAAKCIFQNYSQLLDVCTRQVLKTAEELILPSVVTF